MRLYQNTTLFRGIAFVFAIITLPVQGLAGEPFNSALVHDRFCLSGSQAKLVSEHIELQNQPRQVLANSTATVRFSVGSPGHTCATFPTQVRAAAGSAIPAALAFSLNDVNKYQIAHDSPRKLMFTNPYASVYVYGYGTSYVVVAISTTPTESTELGCNNERSYRVTIKTGKVEPFDGCVEAHKSALPEFSQLPPN